MRQWEDKMLYDEYQEAAIKNIINSDKKIQVLTGGPGRGKTFIIKELISLFDNEIIYLCAPTGKAGRVMEEALSAIQLVNKPSTIHRMLGCMGLDAWTYNEDNRLEADIIIVDESSMVGSLLLARIINSVSEDARIILVGDADQLPPVPAGAPFLDICRQNGKQLVSRLVVNFRQREGSLIADATDRILNRKQILFGQYGKHTLGGGREDDLFFHDLEDKNLIPERALDLCFDWAKDGKEYQILAPQHSGFCGVENINIFMQEKLNPAEKGKREYAVSNFLTLRVGDKVINKKNNYKLDIFNGYVGIIKKISVEGEITVDFDGQTVKIVDKGDIKNLRLAYCLTIHSSQGSEYKNGIVIIHSSHYFMLSNSLLYVAVSRFKECLYIVGNKKGLARAIKNVKSNERNTYLKDILI